MKGFIRFLFYLAASLIPFMNYAGGEESSETPDVSATEGLPSSLVHQSVCAISGEYIDSKVDVVIPGPESLVVRRHYGNLSVGHWSFDHRDRIFFGETKNQQQEPTYVVRIRQPTGAHLDYFHGITKQSSKSERLSFELVVPKGLTNGATCLSGRNHPKNQKVRLDTQEKEIVVTSPAGDKTTYTEACFVEEGGVIATAKEKEKINGSLYTYETGNKHALQLAKIICKSQKTGDCFSQLDIEESDSKDEPVLTLKTSDQREIVYHFKRHKYKTTTKSAEWKSIDKSNHYHLTHVDNPYAPQEKYKYKEKSKDKDLQIVYKENQLEGFLSIGYYHQGENHVGGQIGTITIDDKDDYRLDRVKTLRAPVGKDTTPVTIQRFEYHCKKKKNSHGFKELLDGYTTVYDAFDHRTRYSYNEQHRLTSILRYTGTGTEGSSYHRYAEECFIWGKQKSSDEGNLVARFLKDREDKILHAHTYSYDDKGNVRKQTFCGHLTGNPAPDLLLDNKQRFIKNGYEAETKRFTYNDLNLVTSETDSNGVTIKYNYIDGTDHLKEKFTSYKGRTQLREFYSYDNNYVLKKIVTDDGSTESYKDLTDVNERHFTFITPTQSAPFGLPEFVQERYLDPEGRKVLLKETKNYYTPHGRLERQEVFDANHQLKYELKWEYDDHGNVTSETNALGETVIKKYDDNNNLIYQQGPSPDVEIKNTYDYSNRLTKQEEKHTNGDCFTNFYEYDYLGNCTSITNPYGHVTIQKFDDFNRLIETHYPPINDETGQIVNPVTKKKYNVTGQPTQMIDAKGRTTFFEYNSRGKPIKITHPDGTYEEFRYRLDGQRMMHRNKEGITVHYERDPIGRVIEERTYGTDGHLYKTVTHKYNALHLEETVAADGLITKYTYDKAGRLEKTTQGNRQTQNSYDSLGRLQEVREWFGDEPKEYRSTFKDYDFLNRVTEERIQSSDGKLIHYAHFEYDCNGNCKLTQSGDEITITKYNAQNNPIEITNGLNHSTHTTYDTKHVNSLGQYVLQTTTTDPLGYQTIDTYDAANRLVKVEKKNNPFGIYTARQEIFYDQCGNACRILDHIMEKGESKKTIETQKHYSFFGNQLEVLIEAASTPEQKITRYEYDTLGRQKLFIPPCGTKIQSTYDKMGRLETYCSDDGSIDYFYEYNVRDQITQVTDRKSDQITARTYTTQGEIESEKLGHGLTLEYRYDRLGRTRFIDLPDNTGIEYVYDAVDLKEVHRLKQDKRVYTHSNESYTKSGNVSETKLAGENGIIHYDYDPLGRCVNLSSDHFKQTIPNDGFDKAGNLRQFYSQEQPYTFDYDDLYQIKSETGHAAHSYAFDSLANRTLKDDITHEHNALNQIFQKGKDTFEYDTNGNMKLRLENGQETLYSYDALDRLIGVEQGGKKTTYTYDPFNRRLSKKQDTEQLFLYQGQEEIGLWDGEAIQELRLLGNNIRSPMGAMELKGDLYVPIHDLSGNVVCLQNAQGQVVERYRYTAFGESEILAPDGTPRSHSTMGNPWQYASKRLDAETNLVAFGLRYYDPGLGRWITPDPAGDTDGPNLYAYVHNSPLLYYDQFGLFSLPNLSFNGVFGVTPDIAFSGLTQWLSYSDLGANVQHRFIEDPLNEDKCTRTYQLNDMIDPNTSEKFNFSNLPSNIEICYINGILNNKNGFGEGLSHVGQSIGYNIKGVHSASQGFITDLRCYKDALKHFVAFEAVRELHKLWYDFFERNPDGAYLMFCHSRGAVYVRNALIDFPPELRNRIEVVAIAPGAYIDPNLCKSVKHYISERDVVPLLDKKGCARCKDATFILKPHPQASRIIDHPITSLTYQQIIRDESEDFITRNKGF